MEASVEHLLGLLIPVIDQEFTRLSTEALKFRRSDVQQGLYLREEMDLNLALLKALAVYTWGYDNLGK